MKDKKIAVVGVSSDPKKYGYKIFNDLLKNGYNVYGINPKINTFENQKIYPSLEDLPQIPDVVIIVIKPEIAKEIVKTCIKLGIKEIWFQPGSESTEAIELSKKAGIKTITACFMINNKIW
ncbi:MAG: CoA-binding protein [Elusimicrobiales bacterium]|nr:CoA-binding protein [Elusimicrobiales bacterium]